MFPWLFDTFFDKVVRQVNERTKGGGIKLIHGNGNRGKRRP